MALTHVIAQIDAEIAKLNQVRAMLSDEDEVVAPRARKGTRKGSKPETGSTSTRSKRKLSPEGRKAIADAMKRRWAARRTQTEK